MPEIHAFPDGYTLQRRSDNALAVYTRERELIALHTEPGTLTDTQARLWAQNAISRWIALKGKRPI